MVFAVCVAALNELHIPEPLIDFGRRAKKEVLTKKEAYDLAAKQGLHLSEHGGTGQGVIGALAGIGLRLTGNDGRFKGKVKIKSKSDLVTVKDILAQTDVELVRSLEGTVLKDDELIQLGDKVKAVLLENKCVLLVYSDNNDDRHEPKWKTCTKQQLRGY